MALTYDMLEHCHTYTQPSCHSSGLRSRDPKPFMTTNVLVLYASCSSKPYIEIPTLQPYLHERLSPIQITPVIYLHECRGVPAASKGEGDSSSNFSSARMPKSVTRSSCLWIRVFATKVCCGTKWCSRQDDPHNMTPMLGRVTRTQRYQGVRLKLSCLVLEGLHTLPRRPSCCCITGCC